MTRRAYDLGKAYAAASLSGPTKATRIMLVVPGVPNGTPATTMTRWPAVGKTFAARDPASALHHVVLIARVLGDHAVDAPDE